MHLTIWGGFGTGWGPIWDRFGTDLGPIGGRTIIKKPLVFQWFLHFWGSQRHSYMHLPLWDRFGADLGPQNDDF